MLRNPRTLATMVGGAVVTLAAATPAAAGTSAIAVWNMNEGAHSPSSTAVMQDSSGHGINGTVGKEVRTGVSANGAKVYQFLAANASYHNPNRLVTVADRSAIDPGNRNYAVTVRFKTGVRWENLTQKGQSNTKGGFFKIDMTNGVVYCTFRGAAGFKSIGSGRVLSDQAWHTVRCARDSTGVTITVDGTTSRRIAGVTGSISNSDPLSIGGKIYCNMTTVGCDYVVGLVDYVRIDTF